MDINIHCDENNVINISIKGEVDKREDIENLLVQINNIDKEIHMTFLDANTINNKIVDKLYELQNENRLKVFVLKTYLHSYLYRLGIKSKYIPIKSTYNRDTLEISLMKDYDLDNNEVIKFLKEIYEHYGYDYTKYQISSIIRRIKVSMIRENIKSFKIFKSLILNNGELFEQLFLDFSINTTEFFRNPEVFEEIKIKVLPYLNSFNHIKIWCAGCSTGQEPYSLAILLDELGILNKVQIYATDINPYVIEEAKNGIYSLNGMEKNIENYRAAKGKKSFLNNFKLKGEYMEIHERFKKNILFFQHSLVGNGILNEFQLILCRNVLIYFGNDLQKKILRNFYYSLDKSGFLILGKSEGILQNEGYKFFSNYNQHYRIFKKKY